MSAAAITFLGFEPSGSYSIALHFRVEADSGTREIVLTAGANGAVIQQPFLLSEAEQPFDDPAINDELVRRVDEELARARTAEVVRSLDARRPIVRQAGAR